MSNKLVIASCLLVFSACAFADSIDEAEAKRRGVPVAQVIAENAFAREKAKTAALEKQVAELQQRLAAASTQPAASATPQSVVSLTTRLTASTQATTTTRPGVNSTQATTQSALNKLIFTKYDPFEDKTSVTFVLAAMSKSSDMREFVTVGVIAEYRGTTPTAVTMHAIAVHPFESLASTEMIFLADGERIVLTSIGRHDDTDHHQHSVAFDITRDVLTKLAKAKNVEGKVDNIEFSLWTVGTEEFLSMTSEAKK